MAQKARNAGTAAAGARCSGKVGKVSGEFVVGRAEEEQVDGAQQHVGRRLTRLCFSGQQQQIAIAGHGQRQRVVERRSLLDLGRGKAPEAGGKLVQVDGVWVGSIISAWWSQAYRASHHGDNCPDLAGHWL